MAAFGQHNELIVQQIKVCLHIDIDAQIKLKSNLMTMI